MSVKNSNSEKLKSIIKTATGEEAKIIAVPSELVHFTGVTQKAVFLAQIIYWSDRTTRKDKFFYKNRREWADETGLSANQVERYTKELEKSGFIQTKKKKANGSPTIHYKLENETFLTSFKHSLAIRMSEKSSNQFQESNESLTENTTENTTDIHTTTHSDEWDRISENPVERSEKNVSDEDVIFGDEEIAIPVDFEPTLDYQYRATIKFENKSPSYITNKFVNYYKNKGIKNTLAGWQEKWWDWMIKETPTYGQEEAYKNEHLKIQQKVIWEISNMTFKFRDKIILLTDFCQYAERFYSSATVSSCLEWLIEHKKFVLVDDDKRLFHYLFYTNDAEGKQTIREAAGKLNIDLSQFD